MELYKLENEIVKCNRCSRLREWSQTRQGENVNYKNEEYWGLPVPGFGDHDGRILIVGLAPGVNGANRTGRPFTGDTAGEILFNVLYKHGFSDRPQSSDRNDGLSLKDVYISNAVRCAQPDNKPNSNEFKLCREYLGKEIKAMKDLQVILTLGEDAYKQSKTHIKRFRSRYKRDEVLSWRGLWLYRRVSFLGEFVSYIKIQY